MLYDIVSDAEERVREWLEENGERLNASLVGLDYRCGSIWVTEDAVIVEERNRGSLEYYGGFEYVSKESTNRVGEFTIYYTEGDESERVADVVEAWMAKKLAA
jgi:hypothetical protein